MTNEFYVLKDDEGVLRPMAFIARVGEAGELEKETYKKKLHEGETLVKVVMTEL